MPTYSMNGVASETLYVSRVVTSTTTAEGSLAFSMADDTTVEPVGVTQEGSRLAPGIGSNDPTIAATAGVGVAVYGLGNTALVKCSHAVTAGTRVKVGAANGLIRSVQGSESGGEWTLGIAQEDGVADQLVKVFIDPQQIARPSS